MAMDMEAGIDQQINGKSPSKIQTLNLTNVASKDIKGLTADFVKLETLSLKNAGITNLKGLPKLPKLTSLNLEGNQLNGEDLDRVAENCPVLEHLNLAKNPIKDVTALQPLSKLESLTILNLTGTDLASGDDYQKKVLELLPSLKVLDQKTRSGSPADEDDADDDDDVEEEDDDDSSDEGEDDGPGLRDLLGGDLEDDDDEFEDEEGSNDEEEDDDEDDDDEDAGETPDKTAQLPQGTKRKQREEEDEE